MKFAFDPYEPQWILELWDNCSRFYLTVSADGQFAIALYVGKTAHIQFSSYSRAGYSHISLYAELPEEM